MFGLNSCSSRTLEHRLNSWGARVSLLHSMWDLPGSGIKAGLPALGRRIHHWATREAFFSIIEGNSHVQKFSPNPLGYRTKLGSALPHSKAQLLTPGYGEGKCTICLRASSKGPRQYLRVKRPNSLMAFRGRFLKTRERAAGYVISWWTFFRWIGDEVVKSQRHQPPDSTWSGAYVLVASRQLTSSIWWGFRSLRNSSKDLAQNFIYSLWGGTKSPWLCLRDKLSLFCPAWLLLSAFSHDSDYILWKPAKG